MTFDLTQYNSYRIKAACEAGVLPASEQDLIQALRTAPDAVVIGSGHNLILSKHYYERTFIILSQVDECSTVEINAPRISAFAATMMSTLSERARDAGLSGLEVFYDIPSSLGGALVMNAGASGEEIKDLVRSVRVYNRATHEVLSLQPAELDYRYRSSIFQRHPELIVLSAELELRPAADPAEIRTKMEAIRDARWSKQPRTYPNAGSVFKRPPGFYVGQLVEDLGLKGFSIGGAQISPKHSGFIVNTGNACGADVLAIVAKIQNSVRERHGIHLELEQVVV